MKKLSIYSLPAAATMAAVLMFGAQAYAQTSTSPATPIPGSTTPKNAVDPAPMGGMPARTDATSSSGSAVSNSATMTPGTTKSKDNVMPAPMGGTPTRAMGTSAAGNQVSNSATMTPGTTKGKDDVMPEPTAGSQNMKAKRVAKRAKRQPVASSTSTNMSGDSSQPNLNQPGLDAPRK